jgi:DNA-binding NtrC family response regulator
MYGQDKTDHRSRILVVEDDSEMRSLLTDELSDEGYEVIQAEDGAEAALRVARESFDLVITDMRMPKIGGLALLPVVKEACPDVPVIVITAFADGPTRIEAYEKGAFSYMSKPFKIQDLKDAVSKALLKKGGG